MNFDLAVLERIAAHVEDGDIEAASGAWKEMPTTERGFLAALVLAAAGRPLNQKQVSDAGRFGRAMFTSTAKPSRKAVAQSLAIVLQIAEPLTQFVQQEARTARTLAQAEADIQDRDQTIAALRNQVENMKAESVATEAYARALHRKAYAEYLENLRTREERVVDATPRLTVIKGTKSDDRGAET